MLKPITISLGTALAVAVMSSVSAQTVVALDAGNTLLRFAANAPGSIVSSTPISGLQDGDVLVGLDLRPSNGALYALAGSGRLYTIDPSSSAATLAATLSTAPDGTRFGVDFNPVADRLRVIGDGGQSLRVNVDTGAAIVDGAINPPGAQVVAAAYTRSIAGATATMLYDIDAVASQLLLQNPPNDGTVTPVGPLGVTIGDGTGFDILATGATDTAYAALRVDGVSGFYQVDLASGAASAIGAIGGNPSVVGITLSGTSLPAATPTAGTAIGLTSGNALVRFTTGNPGTIAATTPVTGLQGTDTLVGLDFRPANGQLYALAGSGRLYTVNPASGAATLAATLSITPSGGKFGVDFNPVPDRLRVVSDSGQNLRVNVDTGETILDGAINPPGSPVVEVAYTNSVAGAAATGLYYLDSSSSSLSLQNPPNNGTLVPIGPTGLTIGSNGGFDILSANGGNTAYAALRAGADTGLYLVDLVSGAATLIGAIGGNPDLVGLSLTTATIGGGGPNPSAPIGLPVNHPLMLLMMLLATLSLAAFAIRRRT